MKEAVLEQHAERIAQEFLRGTDFSYVYEDEELEDATEDELKEIHRLITRDMYAVLYP